MIHLELSSSFLLNLKRVGNTTQIGLFSFGAAKELTHPHSVDGGFDNNELEYEETHKIVILPSYANLPFASVELPEKNFKIRRLAVDAILMAEGAERKEHMGIKGLTKLLADNAPKAMKEQKLESYFGRKIAIDASMSIYQFLIVVGRIGTEMLTNEAYSNRADATEDLQEAVEVFFFGHTWSDK
ncbi:hypothetical protein GOBAR_DD22020 [Gossypium barbadense]|nr:hypothetical protein GOBAR_DD22020 [Gossypium barbadense]